MDIRLQNICEKHDFKMSSEVKEIICRAFSRNPFVAKPKAFILIKALNVARAYLKTDNILEIIDWAKKDR